ncbi:MAG: cellulose biosynthesis protein BcsN [Rhizobium sp.]
MHLREIIMLLMLAGLATGCTTTGGVRQSAGPETVANEKALAFPPPGGPAVVSVVERRHKDDVEQTVSLATSSSVAGQNFLKIQFRNVSGANPGLGSTPYKEIGNVAIASEMAAAVPGVRLARSATFVQNGYGPFGYASGQSRGGDTCLYAWQQIRAGQSALADMQNFSMVQVRIRLCDARASERQLLSTVYGYTIAGGFVNEALNPYGTVRGADAVLGQPGDPVYPDRGNYRTGGTPIGYEPVAPRAAIVRRQPVRPPQAAAVEALPAAIGPRVPLPGEQYVPSGSAATSAPASVTGQPQPAPSRNSGAIVPSPDCVGAAANTACPR